MKIDMKIDTSDFEKGIERVIKNVKDLASKPLEVKITVTSGTNGEEEVDLTEESVKEIRRQFEEGLRKL